MTAFQKPEWLIRPDTELRQYAYFTNKIGGKYLKSRNIYIVVPTEVFFFVDSVVPFKNNLKKVGGLFYLDYTSVGRYFFGIATADSSQYIDLWHYTQSNLPPIFE